MQALDILVPSDKDQQLDQDQCKNRYYQLLSIGLCG